MQSQIQPWMQWHLQVRARATGKTLPATLPPLADEVVVFGESDPTPLREKLKGQSSLTLLHAQRWAEAILEGKDPMREQWKVSANEALALWDELDRTYQRNEIPNVATRHALDFFNTLRSEYFPKNYPVQLELKSDPRGSLFEAVRTHQMGQTFLSSTKPGAIRGQHYHLHKLERFCVVSGDAVIRIRKILSHQVMEFPVTGAKPCFIDIPTLHTHDITNTGKNELITLFWTHEFYNPDQPDTWKESVV